MLEHCLSCLGIVKHGYCFMNRTNFASAAVRRPRPSAVVLIHIVVVTRRLLRKFREHLPTLRVVKYGMTGRTCSKRRFLQN